MESSSVTNWVWWVSEWNLWLGVNVPSLRDTVVTLDPTGIDVMGISSAKEVEAVSVSSDSSRSVVLDGLVVSEPSDSLPPLVLVDLGDGIGVLSTSGVPLGGENKSSVVHRSDGLGSPVEGPPLLSVVSVVVLDSEVVLSTSSRVGDNERSVGSHSGSELELNSISDWESVVSLYISLQVEALPWMVSAGSEGHMSQVSVCVV